MKKILILLAFLQFCALDAFNVKCCANSCRGPICRPKKKLRCKKIRCCPPPVRCCPPEYPPCEPRPCVSKRCIEYCL